MKMCAWTLEHACAHTHTCMRYAGALERLDDLLVTTSRHISRQSRQSGWSASQFRFTSTGLIVCCLSCAHLASAAAADDDSAAAVASCRLPLLRRTLLIIWDANAHDGIGVASLWWSDLLLVSSFLW